MDLAYLGIYYWQREKCRGLVYHELPPDQWCHRPCGGTTKTGQHGWSSLTEPFPGRNWWPKQMVFWWRANAELNVQRLRVSESLTIVKI